MFKKEDILARMLDGDSVEEIAAEITGVLNEASAEYEKSKIAECAYKKKVELARKFNDILIEYAKIECPEAVDNMNLEDEDVDSMITAIDELFKMFSMFAGVAETLKKCDCGFPSIDRKTGDKAKASDDEILNDFISKLLA